jgi:hypothetical protein
MELAGRFVDSVASAASAHCERLNATARAMAAESDRDLYLSQVMTLTEKVNEQQAEILRLNTELLKLYEDAERYQV